MKVFKKVFKRRRSIQVVKEVLHGHSRTGEAPRSTHDLGVSDNDGRVHSSLHMHEFTSGGSALGHNSMFYRPALARRNAVKHARYGTFSPQSALW